MRKSISVVIQILRLEFVMILFALSCFIICQQVMCPQILQAIVQVYNPFFMFEFQYSYFFVLNKLYPSLVVTSNMQCMASVLMYNEMSVDAKYGESTPIIGKWLQYKGYFCIRVILVFVHLQMISRRLSYVKRKKRERKWLYPALNSSHDKGWVIPRIP